MGDPVLNGNVRPFSPSSSQLLIVFETIFNWLAPEDFCEVAWYPKGEAATSDASVIGCWSRGQASPFASAKDEHLCDLSRG